MLSDMLRQSLLTLSEQERVKKTVIANPASRSLVSRYIAGETVTEAVDTCRKLHDQGLRATVDYLGEDTTDPALAQHTRDIYLELLRELSEAGLADNGTVEVSIKPSALGTGLPEDARHVAFEYARDIVVAATAAGTTVTVDMEDHTTTQPTLDLVAELRQEHDSVGAVVQSYLFRTVNDCSDLASSGARVRLCKGAYDQPSDIAHVRKHDIDKAYVQCLRTLMESEAYPMVATHDSRLVTIAETLAVHHNRGPADWEVQMLLGVRPNEQKRLAADGKTVRVYVPFGDNWYGYMMRRLAERPANTAFFVRSLLTKG